MTWDTDSIRHLRLRLGWTYTDLARHLEVDTMMIFDWESGKHLPTAEVFQKLDLFSKQAEMSAFEILAGPRAESFLEKNSQEQCEIDNIVDIELNS